MDRFCRQLTVYKLFPHLPSYLVFLKALKRKEKLIHYLHLAHDDMQVTPRLLFPFFKELYQTHPPSWATPHDSPSLNTPHPSASSTPSRTEGFSSRAHPPTPPPGQPSLLRPSSPGGPSSACFPGGNASSMFLGARLSGLPTLNAQ